MQKAAARWPALLELFYELVKPKRLKYAVAGGQDGNNLYAHSFRLPTSVLGVVW